MCVWGDTTMSQMVVHGDFESLGIFTVADSILEIQSAVKRHSSDMVSLPSQ